ncbi:MAG TPA: ectoine/hydroxyectoine ABC transporter permease subunit EhuC [Thermotogota bacterium]|nr:ectoine/hydroxyectoine ABC transporter permease subunit EhuC [Thermotogota bacterium]HRW92640.1 ectoine/hydroxyectoine ABC transporter permease subunit EhuC [Thermotogota bacterium]
MPEIVRSFPFLLQGALITLWLTLASGFFGTIIGTLAGMGRLSAMKALRYPSSVYVEFIRGTPLLVQIYIIYFGLPSLGLDLKPFTAAVVALTINAGAYTAEIVRAGIQSIDKGQMEAARSLGMTGWQSMFHVILPQAFRNVLPALGNEFIALAKESSLVSVIGIAELTRQGQYVISRTFKSFEIYGGVALIYFALTFSMSQIVGWVEKKVKIP